MTLRMSTNVRFLSDVATADNSRPIDMLSTLQLKVLQTFQINCAPLYVVLESWKINLTDSRRALIQYQPCCYDIAYQDSSDIL